MAVSSASRFAVLHVEDDSDDSDCGSKDAKSAILTNNKDSNNKKGKGPTAGQTTQTKNKSKKKKNANSDSAELQNLIFGTGKSKTKSGGGGNQGGHARGQVKDSQWEEWKEKDSKFVSDSYEQDLQQALLLSKVHFEENKELRNMIRCQQRSDQAVVDVDPEEVTRRSKKKSSSSGKKDKGPGATTMSLEQFNNLLPSQIEAGLHNLAINGTFSPTENGVVERPAPLPEPEEDFFCKIKEAAGNIIKNEKRRDNFKKNEPFLAEQVLSLELRDELEKKDKVIEELTSANTKLQEELKSVKYRNKKLCNILAQGEMKDKAEILVQSEKLRNLRDELTDEVKSLHAALEQEKSKVHQLQSDLKKQLSGKREQKKESTS